MDGLIPIEAELAEIERRLTELKARLDALEKEVIANARVVAATLTKCYLGNQLNDESFDALIVDEISMALPPPALCGRSPHPPPRDSCRRLQTASADCSWRQ